MNLCIFCFRQEPNGRRWQRLNLTEAIKTVAVGRGRDRGSRQPSEESSHTWRGAGQSSAETQESGSQPASRSSSRRSGRQLQPAQAGPGPAHHPLDSGIASIEESSSCAGVAGRCNGRLQRASRVEEAEDATPPHPALPAIPSCSPPDSATATSSSPTLWPPPPAISVPGVPATTSSLPGLQPTNSRCPIQTSGWL